MSVQIQTHFSFFSVKTLQCQKASFTNEQYLVSLLEKKSSNRLRGWVLSHLVFTWCCRNLLLYTLFDIEPPLKIFYVFQGFFKSGKLSEDFTLFAKSSNYRTKFLSANSYYEN